MMHRRLQSSCLEYYINRPFRCIIGRRNHSIRKEVYQAASHQFVPPSFCNLGVWEVCLAKYPNTLRSIQQLPEVESSIQTFHKQRQKSDHDGSVSFVIDAVERSVQIFSSIQPGSSEHVACLGLLAEIQFQCNMKNACDETLRNMLDICARNGLQLVDSIRLAQAKAYWLNGEHENAMTICTLLIDQETTPLDIEIAARNGQSLSRLLQVSSLDDAFSVRDPFRAVIHRLERSVLVSSTTKAAAYLNMGIAEAVYAETVARHHDVDDVPLDGAMRAWKVGLTALKHSDQHGTTAPTTTTLHRTLLQSRLQANMAWGMLQMTRESDYVHRASSLAGQALATHNDSVPNSESDGPINSRSSMSSIEGLGRILSLVAACYHKSGNSVMAQGLFQSAIDQQPLAQHPVLYTLEKRDALERYAKLCLDWEKREGDAARLHEQADELNATLPCGWRGKSAVHGSLWFWTP